MCGGEEKEEIAGCCVHGLRMALYGDPRFISSQLADTVAPKGSHTKLKGGHVFEAQPEEQQIPSHSKPTCFAHSVKLHPVPGGHR